MLDGNKDLYLKNFIFSDLWFRKLSAKQFSVEIFPRIKSPNSYKIKHSFSAITIVKNKHLLNGLILILTIEWRLQSLVCGFAGGKIM